MTNTQETDSPVSQLPKCLVVSATPLGGISATGALMATLFDQWKPDRLRALFQHPLTPAPQFQSSCIRAEEVFAGKVPRWRRVGGRLFKGLNARPPVIDQSKLMKWVNAFRPDVLYYRPVELPLWFSEIPLIIHREAGTPIVTHIMDDWPMRLEEPSHQANLKNVQISRIKDNLRLVLEKSAVCMAISNGMATAFQKRHGRSFEVIHNGVSLVDSRPRRISYDQKPGHPFTIGYSGSLAVDMQLESLTDVARSVQTLRDDGLDIELVVRTNAIWKATFDQHLSGFRGTVNRDQVEIADYPDSLAACDALLIAANFDRASLSYIRYSMSNKLCECLASATPILAYGPEEAETIRTVIEHDCGAVVSTRSPKLLTDAIRSLVGSTDARRSLGLKGYNACRRQFDLEVIQSRFERLIRSASIYMQRTE